nr:hypothetical protein [Spirochaetota bacterium]
MKEINAHTDIPMTAENRIPGNAECYQLIQRYEMLPNIVEHSEQVTRVALAVTDDLIDPTAVDRELIRASSLLHDITKT